MPKLKVIFYPAPEKALSPDEIKQVFARFSEKDDIMVALRQILTMRLANATQESTEPDLTERTAGIAAGRLTEISELQDELAGYHRAAAELRKHRAVEVKPAGKV